MNLQATVISFLCNSLVVRLFFFLNCSKLCSILQAITTSSMKKNEIIFGEIQSQLKNKNMTILVKANSDSNVSIFFSLCFLYFCEFHSSVFLICGIFFMDMCMWGFQIVCYYFIDLHAT